MARTTAYRSLTVAAQYVGSHAQFVTVHSYNTGLPPELPEEGVDVRSQRLRLFEGGEVAAAVHRRPALDVEHALGHRAWWPNDLAREGM